VNTLGTLALIGWIPLVLAAFATWPARRVVIGAYLLGWMFLPVASIAMPGPLDWSKINVTNLAVLLGIAIFDARRFSSLSPSWIDLPIVVWCLCPIPTALSNDLGAYDGFANALNQTVAWGVPYLVGRCYFATWRSGRELALALVVGGLLYAPLCVWEARMSPQLHHIVYGFHQHSFDQAVRGSSFRPTVFMHHGLMVAMWIAMSAMIACLLWLRGGIRRIGSLPIAPVALVLFGTSVICKSLGALLLLGTGVCTLLLLRRGLGRLPLFVLVAAPLLYVALRIEGIWTGDFAVELSARVSEERAASLRYRLDSEKFLIERASERPWFGWGGYGRNNTYIDEHEELIDVIVDGLWIITFGQLGLVGLLALNGALLLPVVSFARRVSPALWSRAGTVPLGALALIPPLFLADSLFNSMLNPLYLLIAGGLARMRVPRPARPKRPFIALRRARPLAMRARAVVRQSSAREVPA
jgi:hypothetical protein